MEYVEIARFNSRLEAETIGHALDQFGIPFVVEGHDIGMFGPGFAGQVPGGAGLRVPADRADEASDLLHCAVQPETEAETENEAEPAAGNREE